MANIMNYDYDLLKSKLEELRIADLKDLLCSVGSSRRGTKPDLVERCMGLMEDEKNVTFVKNVMEKLGDDFAKVLVPEEEEDEDENSSDESSNGSRDGNNDNDTDEYMNVERTEMVYQPARTKDSYSCFKMVKRVQRVKKPKPPRLSPLPNPSPDVIANLIMKPMPFYEELKIVQPPTFLPPKCPDSITQTFRYRLRLSKSDECLLLCDDPTLADLFIRFCEIDEDSEEKHDSMPANLKVFVNGTPVPRVFYDLKEEERDSYSEPLELSQIIARQLQSSHEIMMKWDWENPPKHYAFSLVIARACIIDEVIDEMMLSQYISPKEGLKNVKEFMGNEPSVKVSIKCPISKTRIIIPCRSIICKHLECFDTESFFKKLSSLRRDRALEFSCPVCEDIIQWEDVKIDGFMMTILNNLEAGKLCVEIFADGGWQGAEKTEEMKKLEEKESADFKEVDYADMSHPWYN